MRLIVADPRQGQLACLALGTESEKITGAVLRGVVG
jgi:hypothetical protein